EAAPRGRDRELEHADLQRNDGAGPVPFVRPHHRQRREAAVIERLPLEVREVEFVRGERERDVAGEPGVALYRRQMSRPAAFIGDRILPPPPEPEAGVVIEKKRRNEV